MRREIAGFPVVVESSVKHLIVEQPVGTFELIAIKTRSRKILEKKIISIWCAVFKRNVDLRGKPRIAEGLESGVETEVRSEHERTAVIAIVAHIEVGHRRL